MLQLLAPERYVVAVKLRRRSVNTNHKLVVGFMHLVRGFAEEI